jgi:hypothetical protein
MKNLDQYLLQAETEKVQQWVRINLKNYLKKNEENQTEIEHIIDFLKSDKAPTRIQFMSYDEANKGAEKWTNNLIKKAADIVETEADVKTYIDFGDGFKFVKLKGKNAFDREGNLMRHCVAGYYDKKGCKVYSLRDPNNNPHCTIEIVKEQGIVQQIKGKGNGPIHPKYISYVLQFLKKKKMDIRDNEMENLGYSCLDFLGDGTWQYLEENFKGIKYISWNNKKYFYNKSQLRCKNG